MAVKLNALKELIYLATIFESDINGDFIKNIIIPRMKQPDCNVNIDDITLYFRECVTWIMFLTELQHIFTVEKVSYNKYDIRDIFNNEYFFSFYIFIRPL